MRPHIYAISMKSVQIDKVYSIYEELKAISVWVSNKFLCKIDQRKSKSVQPNSLN